MWPIMYITLPVGRNYQLPITITNFQLVHDNWFLTDMPGPQMETSVFGEAVL